MTRAITVPEARKLGLLPGGKRAKAAPRSKATHALITAEARSTPGSVTLCVPVKLVSESNAREHWRKRHARNVAQQAMVLRVAEMVHPTLRPPPPEVGGWRMRFVRIAPTRLDPGNIGNAFKHVQDAAARWLGVKNERDARYLFWDYDQRNEGVRLYGCEIQISWGAQ